MCAMARRWMLGRDGAKQCCNTTSVVTAAAWGRERPLQTDFWADSVGSAPARLFTLTHAQVPHPPRPSWHHVPPRAATPPTQTPIAAASTTLAAPAALTPTSLAAAALTTTATPALAPTTTPALTPTAAPALAPTAVTPTSGVDDA